MDARYQEVEGERQHGEEPGLDATRNRLAHPEIVPPNRPVYAVSEGEEKLFALEALPTFPSCETASKEDSRYWPGDRLGEIGHERIGLPGLLAATCLPWPAVTGGR